MINKWTIFGNTIKLQQRSAIKLERIAFSSSSRKPNLIHNNIKGKREEGKHAFQHDG
jgi:hypothetical protein